jgi:hypothetical protein
MGGVCSSREETETCIQIFSRKYWREPLQIVIMSEIIVSIRCEGVGCIQLARDMFQWPKFLYVVVNFLFYERYEIYCLFC